MSTLISTLIYALFAEVMFFYLVLTLMASRDLSARTRHATQSIILGALQVRLRTEEMIDMLLLAQTQLKMMAEGLENDA